MYRYVKRVIDVAVALLVGVVVLPFMLPIVVGLLLTGEHYVFYLQERVGRGNRKFGLWKFATMLKNSPNMSGGLHTMRRDPRVLPMGGFLRMTKINELPQIINILKGDMSLVGPRPLVDKTFEPYPEEVKERIYNVRPGLTGVGSVVFRDEERLLSECEGDPAEFYARYIAPAKGALELWYQDNLSFMTDMKLIFLTAWVIVFPRSRLLYRWLRGLPEVEVPGLGGGEC